MKHFLNIFLPAFVSVLIASCVSTPPVQRVSPDQVTDLSGRWNDTDSKAVSTEMVQDMLSRAWLDTHQRQFNKPPTVIVGFIENTSSEHINTQTFTNDIERELINSGQINFVADSIEREQLREERYDQDLNASAATRKAIGEELGADYMLIGSINSILDGNRKTLVTYYQVDLKLVSLRDNRTAWVGQKKIKKIIDPKRTSY